LRGCRRFFGVLPIVFVFLVAAAGCANLADTSYMMRMSGESSQRGEEALAAGDSSVALERFKEALRIDRSMVNRKGELADLINLGRANISLGRYSEATGFLNEAIMVAVEISDNGRLSEAHAVFARAEYMAGYTAAALDHIEEALQIDKGIGVRSGAKLTLKGLILTGEGRFAEAQNAIDEALSINTAAHDAARTADSYRAYGKLYTARKKAAEALEYYEKAYGMDHTGTDPVTVASDLAAMAELNLSLGERARAAQLFERSYVVSFNSGRRDDAAIVLDRVIGVYTELGDANKAAFYRKVKDGVYGGG